MSSMRKAKIVCLIIWVVLALTYTVDGSYEMGFAWVFFMLMCVLNAILCVLSGRSLQAALHLPYSMEKTKCAEGTIVMTNLSLIPVFKGQIKIVWKNTLTGEEGSLDLPFHVMPKGMAAVCFDVSSCCCGYCSISVEEVTVFDMFGIFSGKRESKAQGSIFLFPETYDIQLELDRTEAYDMESFRYSEEKKGDDSSETFDIRAYVQGDSMRKIHWKLTGKLGTLMVREASHPVYDSVMLLLETGYEKERPLPGEMDAAVEQYFSVAEMLLEQEKSFDIGFYDYEKDVFCWQKIEDRESLWEMALELLKAGRRQSPVSVWHHCCSNTGDRHFSHYCYVAADGSYDEVDAAAEMETITILRRGSAPGRE